MTSDVSELVVEHPSASTIRDIARVVSGRAVELERILLTGDTSTIRDILDKCSEGDVKLADDQDSNSNSTREQVDRLRFSIGSATDINQDPPSPKTLSTTPPVANGGSAVYPRIETGSLPDRTGFATTGEWVDVVAEQVGIESESLLEIATWVNEEERTSQIKHLLELAFQHHLNRPKKGGRGYVEIRASNQSFVGHYHYMDNGRGRGGAHYFRGVTSSVKEVIRRIALEEKLIVLSEGESYVSVSFERVDVEADVRFVELIMQSVFDLSLGDIVAIEEYVGREVACTWIS